MPVVALISAHFQFIHHLVEDIFDCRGIVHSKSLRSKSVKEHTNDRSLIVTIISKCIPSWIAADLRLFPVGYFGSL